DSVLDYTEYLFVGQYLPYYICDASVTYPAEAPAGNCYDARTFLAGNTKSNVFSRELRFNTPTDNRWRSTFGVFFSDTEILELNDFTYPGSVNVESFTPGVFGFPPNYPLPGAWRQDPGPFPEEVIFRNDIRRTDEQYGAFAELSWDLVPDTLTITGGIRNYEIDVDLQGSANSSFGNLGQAEDQQRFGANLSALYNGSNNAEVGGRTISLPDTANAGGNIYKLNLAWTPRDGSLFYATYSEGFRPPLLNRPVGAGGVVPAVVRTDELVNWEIGGKTLTADRNLQLNWSAFIENIDDLQSTIFDSNIVNLFFSDNAANARVRGVEADFIWLPEAIDGLTVSGAISLLDTEILETISTTSAIAPAGSELANAPGFQTSLRARYEWSLGNGMDAWIMPQLSHSSSSYSDIVLINRIEQDAWTVLDVSAGVIRGNWRVDARIGNLTDERAVLTSWYGNDRERLAINRPRSLGIQVTYEM
ncbi:MAG: TonB-dependent receptor, partial [Gammaproteobacteria bacterium]|nr:TonB-dependent receptor [Gammaproteobacteria bacterium]